MNVEEVKPSSQDNQQAMCVCCQLFFGNQDFNHMCSQCYKK